jgi:hypothetical protein
MSGREIARDTHLAGETGTSLAETGRGMNPGHQRQRGKSDDGVLREAHNHWRDRTDTQPGRHARDRLQLLRRRCPHHSDQYTNLGTVQGAIGVPSTVRGCHSRAARRATQALAECYVRERRDAAYHRSRTRLGSGFHILGLASYRARWASDSVYPASMSNNPGFPRWIGVLPAPHTDSAW